MARGMTRSLLTSTYNHIQSQKSPVDIDIGDYTSNCMRIIISQYKDPYKPTSITV